MPKFFAMRRWPDVIRTFGSANVTSTGFGERSHVILKESMQFTNRRSAEAIDEQVIIFVHAQIAQCLSGDELLETASC